MYKLPPVTLCIKGNISNLHHIPMKYFYPHFTEEEECDTLREMPRTSARLFYTIFLSMA